MNIIFFGTPKDVVPVLENLVKCFNVVSVVTAPDRKAGRKQLLTPSPVKVFAEKHTIPVLQPENVKELTSLLSSGTSDLFIVAAYGKLIPDDILTLPEYGAINIHPSLLPEYRGATPIQTMLLNGDKKSGVTFIRMDEQMDHGPILHRIPFTIETTDTFGWLMQSMFAQAAQILPTVIDEYTSGRLEPKPQDDSLATYTKIITKQDGFIDLDKPPAPEKLDRMIRAYYPWPSIWTQVNINNREMTIKFLPEHKLQVEGKNPVTIKDFINGYPEMKIKIEKLLAIKEK